MKRSLPARLFFVAATAGLLSARVETDALAQSDGEIALAKQWFHDGEAAEKKKDWPKALELFEKALTVKQTPQILVRVGTLDERVGKLVEALVAYDRAVEKANAAQLPDVAMVAKESGDALRPRVPTIAFAPAEPYAGLSVSVDGATLAPATLSEKVPVNPGQHKIAASAPGHESFETSVTVAESDAKSLPIQLKALASAAPPPSATPTSAPDAPPPAPSKLPYVLIGAGAAGVVAGVVLFAVAAGKNSTVNSECGGADRLTCPQSMEDQINSQVSSVNTFRVVSLALGGLGLVSAGAGAYLLFTAPKAAPAKPASGRWIDVKPTFDGRSGVGLAARGAF